MSDIDNVKRNIASIYEKRKAALFALSSDYAVNALNTFRNNQAGEKYWKNRTFDAMDRVFTKPFQFQASVGWRISHGVDYGTYLEKANDRRHEALRPIVKQFAKSFKNDVNKLYGGKK